MQLVAVDVQQRRAPHHIAPDRLLRAHCKETQRVARRQVVRFHSASSRHKLLVRTRRSLSHPPPTPRVLIDRRLLGRGDVSREPAGDDEAEPVVPPAALLPTPALLSDKLPPPCASVSSRTCRAVAINFFFLTSSSRDQHQHTPSKASKAGTGDSHNKNPPPPAFSFRSILGRVYLEGKLLKRSGSTRQLATARPL